jgi:hypothetical protein
MRIKVLAFIVFFMIMFIHTSAVHSLDTSSPLLCSVIKAAEYAVEEGCTEGTAESFDIPQFIKFNFQEKIISEVGETGKNRKSTIMNLVESNSQLVMQGVENDRSWSAVIGDTGKMTATISDSEFGFVIFGACLRQ